MCLWLINVEGCGCGDRTGGAARGSGGTRDTGRGGQGRAEGGDREAGAEPRRGVREQKRNVNKGQAEVACRLFSREINKS